MANSTYFIIRKNTIITNAPRSTHEFAVKLRKSRATAINLVFAHYDEMKRAFAIKEIGLFICVASNY